MTTTRDEGIGSRLVNSFFGMLIGFVLFVLSFVVLWWNEGNVIAEKNALNELSSALVEAKADQPNKAQFGHLVHAVGKLTSDDKVGDKPYLKPGPYLLVERHVEMFQWIEKSTTTRTKSVGGSQRTTTTYTYSQGWSEQYNDSNSFHMTANHQNPPQDVANTKLKVKHVKYGKLEGGAVLDRIDSRENLQVTDALLLAGKDKKGDIHNGMLYLRKSVGSGTDQIGDHRLSWKVVRAGTASVIAKQTAAGYTPYTTKNGRSEFLVTVGSKPAKAMIQTAKEEAGTLAMVFRVVGFFMMWIGLNLLAGPLTTMLDVLPFLGSASRFLLAVVFFVVALALTLVTIVLSMIAHHPVVAVLLLLAGGGAAYYFWRKKKQAAGMHREKHAPVHPDGGEATPPNPLSAEAKSHSPAA